MRKKLPDVRKLTLDGSSRDRLVTIQKTVYLSLIVRVTGHGAETVVLQDFGDIVLAEILPQRFYIPRDQCFDILPVAQGQEHPFENGRAYAQVGNLRRLIFHRDLLSCLYGSPRPLLACSVCDRRMGMT